MLQSLYESLINGLITADEYQNMRADYTAKMQEGLNRAATLERRQTELDRQIVEYLELSDLIENADSMGITAELIDALVDRIIIFPDRRIEVAFRFESGYGLIDEVIAHA
jgi:hypothetical protein